MTKTPGTPATSASEHKVGVVKEGRKGGFNYRVGERTNPQGEKTHVWRKLGKKCGGLAKAKCVEKPKCTPVKKETGSNKFDYCRKTAKKKPAAKKKTTKKK